MKSILERKYLLLAMILLISTVVTLFLTRPQKSKEFTGLSPQDAMEVFKITTIQLQKIYEDGDVDSLLEKNKLSCPDLVQYSKSIDPSYYRCNRDYLECHLKGGAGKAEVDVEYNGEKFSVVAIRDSKGNYTRSFFRESHPYDNYPQEGIQIRLRILQYPDYEIRVAFENLCRDIYLPQKVYGFGPFRSPTLKKTQDWRWDNFNRHIFIDRFMVTWRDIKDWVENFYVKLNVPKELKELAKPAHGLSMKQMKEYCAARGAHLLEAHVWDAATAYRWNLKEKDSKLLGRSLYPWVASNKKSFLYKYLLNKNLKATLTEKDCNKAYVKECTEEHEYIHHNTSSTTWMGIYQILGGYIEAMRNPLHSEYKLKPSSRYFSAGSIWHQNGMRVMWDGLDEITWESRFELRKKYEYGKPEIEKPEIGFRCMSFVND